MSIVFDKVRQARRRQLCFSASSAVYMFCFEGTGGSGGKGPQGTAAQASTIVGTPDGCSRNVGYGGNGGTGGTGDTLLPK